MTTPPGSRRARRLLGLPLGLLTALLLSLAGPLPTAQATITYLCQGYDRCQQQGYSHAGYKQAGHRMYWRMYSGHNCTNYAAYRMVRSGMANERPWSGSGNAMYWGTSMRSITDDTPMVGAVAWWRAGVPGAGSVGHVAYVERVVNKRTIIVSEDSWGGDFGWKRITKRGSGWPSGFIHFNDRAVRATTAPTVSGRPAVGRPYRVDVGAWQPAATVTVQWFVAGEPIPGATEASYTPTAEQRLRRLSVKVTAKARGYQPQVTTLTAPEKVTRGTLRQGAAPVLSGTPRVDEVLTLQPGAATPAADTTLYRWYADGERIAGADGPTLRLTQHHIRTEISAAVVSRKRGYHQLVTRTAPSAPVQAGRIQVTEPFGLAGTPSREQVLSVTPGTVDPADATVAYQWLRDGAPIPRATDASYVATVDDVGHQVSVRVALSRTSYRDRSFVLAASGPVTTRPTLRVTSLGRPGRAVVRLRVTAPGVSAPRGEATVRVGRKSVVGDVANGRLRVVVGSLERGRHEVRVRYAGTTVVLPGAATTTVRVPRR